MRGAAGAGEVVQIDLTIPPNALVPNIKDKLSAVPKTLAVQFIVDAGVAGAFQGIVNSHELLSAGDNRIAPLLIPPDASLDPGVHVPGVLRPPDIIYTQGAGLVGKNAGRVSVIVSHHDLHGGVRDFSFVSPSLPLQAVAHAAALGTAETNRSCRTVFVVHLMQGTFT